MAEISYRRHRFPPVVIQNAVWLYLRFTLSYRDVGDLLAERGLDISYETVRSWVLKFGPVIARRLRRRHPRPSNRWHLDKMVVRIAGRRMYLWRAVDHEGEVLDMLVQRRRDTRCALPSIAAWRLDLSRPIQAVQARGERNHPLWRAPASSATVSRRKLCAGVWAAASGPDANGLYLGAPPLRNQKFADSPVEGTGFELLVRGRVKLVVGRRRQRN
jgi:DDE domain